MGELPRHESVAFETGTQLVVAAETSARCSIGQFEQEAPRTGHVIYRTDDGIDDARLTRRADGTQTDFTFVDDLAPITGARQSSSEHLSVDEQFGERPTAGLVESHGQQALCRDVGVDDAEVRIEQHDACQQRIEQIRRVVMRGEGLEETFNRHGCDHASRPYHQQL